MSEKTRLIIGLFAALVGLTIIAATSAWLAALFTQAGEVSWLQSSGAVAWLKSYAFLIELSVNLLSFMLGLFAMSLFKVNVDGEIKGKGRLEKMTIVAFLLDDLGYNTADAFIKQHFRSLAEEDKPKGKKEPTV